MLDKTLSLLLIRIFEFDGAELETALRYVKLLLQPIKSKYAHLTIEDIRAFVEETCTRSLGHSFGKVSPSMVLEWLNIYSARRFDEIEGLVIQEHQQYKYTPNYQRQDIEKFWKEQSKKLQYK